MSHIARKRFGQNFLNDPFVLSQIVNNIPPCSENETWLEIGPGLGALTRELLKRSDCPRPLRVVEIDRDLAVHLEKTFSDRIALTTQDILKFDLSTIEQPIRIIGNLPYNLSTPILFYLIDHLPHIRSIHIMLQKEVVDRITASVNTRDYGRLTVMLQHDLEPHRAPFLIPPSAFDPAPKVESAWVNLYPKNTSSRRAQNQKMFHDLVQAAFSTRRKTLKNALKSKFPDLNWEALASWLDPIRRAETLTVLEFIQLSDTLSALECSQ